VTIDTHKIAPVHETIKIDESSLQKFGKLRFAKVSGEGKVNEQQLIDFTSKPGRRALTEEDFKFNDGDKEAFRKFLINTGAVVTVTNGPYNLKCFYFDFTSIS
jgi:hypothetical protein